MRDWMVWIPITFDVLKVWTDVNIHARLPLGPDSITRSLFYRLSPISPFGPHYTTRSLLDRLDRASQTVITSRRRHRMSTRRAMYRWLTAPMPTGVPSSLAVTHPGWKETGKVTAQSSNRSW